MHICIYAYVYDICIYPYLHIHTYIQQKLAKSTNHGTDSKKFIYGDGRFKKLDYHCNRIVWVIVWDVNKTIDIGEWLIYGGGWIERYYCIYIYIYIYERAS